MTNSLSKRKWAGEPHKDQRKAPAPDALHLPPHKKPRLYRLTLRYERTTTSTYTKEFPSKAAMQEHRARVKRAIAYDKAERKKAKPKYWSYWYGKWYDLKMECQESSEFTKEPEIIEEMLECSPPKPTASNP